MSTDAPAVPTQKKKKVAQSINMLNEPRFIKVWYVFKRRGLSSLPMLAMVRIVIDEWLEANKGK